MIYLLDEKLADTSHSKFILDLIKNHTDIQVQLIEIPNNPTFGQINQIIFNLFNRVKPSDIVLCPWAVDANNSVDQLFNDLADLCWVVVAAGNFNQSIEKYSPARAENVITVACLNKSGLKAALSNWSNTKELVWIPGTNYNVGWKNSSGTSVSAAVYAALLAESTKYNDSNYLETLIKEYSDKVFLEINPIKQQESIDDRSSN